MLAGTASECPGGSLGVSLSPAAAAATPIGEVVQTGITSCTPTWFQNLPGVNIAARPTSELPLPQRRICHACKVWQSGQAAHDQVGEVTATHLAAAAACAGYVRAVAVHT